MNRLSKDENQVKLEEMIIKINETINEMAGRLDAISEKLLRIDGAVDLFQEDSRLMFKVLARISNQNSVSQIRADMKILKRIGYFLYVPAV